MSEENTDDFYCGDSGEEEPMDCSLCFQPLELKRTKDTRDMKWKYGNNAAPFEGRCCDICDCLIVIPARMGMISPEGVALGQSMLMMRLGLVELPNPGK